MKRLSACALSLALSVSMILPAGAAGATFSDVPQGHWAYDSVERMVQRGVMEGVGGGRFAPDKWLSSAEFSVMLTQVFCPEKISSREGRDWWEPYVNAASEAGYLTDTTAGWSHYENGRWDASAVEAPMNRYDMAQAMWNTVVAEGLTTPTGEQREAAQRAIGDFASIPEDYESAVVAMYALGCLAGVNENGDFGGQQNMTRAQASIVMDRLLSLEPAQNSQPQQAQAQEEPARELERAGEPEQTQEPAEEPAQPAQTETAATPDNSESQSDSGIDVAAWEQEVFSLVNQIREENGLKPFVYNETLAETARAHSQDMIDRNFFDHYNPDGQSPFDRMRANGIRYSMAAENIAVGYPSPEAVVEGWMNSEGHRANILGGCRELGVGLALGGSYGYYWTQCFATVR